MYRTAAAVAGVLLLALNGALHGVWTHRWEDWTEPRIQATAGRLAAVPLRVGEWVGEPVPGDPQELPEEVTGRGVTVRYVSRADGTAVVVYLAAAPTDAAIAHTPRVCYPAVGYSCPAPDLRVDDGGREFWMSSFAKTGAAVPTHLRVFWAWSDGRGWRVPANPGRTFRREPVLYKCYAVRYLADPDEPIDGDPCLRLLGELLPAVDGVLGGN
jgi:hypothetical protein